MSRFKWLEVSGRDREKKEPSEAPEEKGFDEHYFLRLADENYAEGNYEMALRYYSRALNLNLQIEKAWVGQLLCLVDLGEYKEAITWADKTLEIFPGSAEAIAVKALAWGRLGDQDKAIAFSDSSLKTADNSSLVWWVRGDILVVENPKNAEFCFRKAMEIDRNNWLLFLRAGRTYMSVGKPVLAREQFLRSRNLKQDNPLVWYWLGISYRELGMIGKAVECLRRTVDLRPGHKEYAAALTELRQMGPVSRLLRKLRVFFR